VERLARVPGVRAAVPALMMPAAIKTKRASTGTVVVGVDTAASFRPFRMVSGEPLAHGDGAGLLMGLSLAEQLEAKVGDTVSLRVLFATGPSLFEDENVGRYAMSVRGLVGGTLGAQEIVFVDRSFLTQEAAMPEAASMILVYLDDHGAAKAVAE